MSQLAKNNIQIYTDGSCLKNPGQGAWAYLILDHINKKIYMDAQCFEQTTNNQMEMQACLQALKKIAILNDIQSLNFESIAIDLYTDSQYLKNGINEWIFAWKKNNWKTAAKQPVKNQNLWHEIDALNSKIKPQWHWVKAHSINDYNNFVDEIARLCATKQAAPDQRIFWQVFCQIVNLQVKQLQDYEMN
jgi:ribonuclease HI